MVKSKNIYKVPINKKDIIFVISDPRAHNRELKHALDFSVPIGTKIYSTGDGEVTAVKVDSKCGGPEEKYDHKKYLNYIEIKHKNNEYSEYGHLKYKGAAVKIGQYVKAGDLIGLSGNTGYTTAPHLHFQVFKKDNSKIGWKTLKIRFDKPLIIRTKPSDFTKKELKILYEMSTYAS